MAKSKRQKSTKAKAPIPRSQQAAHDMLAAQDKTLSRLFDTYIIIGQRTRTKEEAEMTGSPKARMYFYRGPLTVIGGMVDETREALVEETKKALAKKRQEPEQNT